MMNDGEDNENAVVGENSGVEVVSASEQTGSSPEATAPTDNAAEGNPQDTPLKKIVQVAESALHTTVKVTNDVASKVVQVSTQAFDSTQNAVRRMSKKGSAESSHDNKSDGGDDVPAEETAAAEATEIGSGEEQPKESIWGKVRRASGTAAVKAAGVAQAAYKAAEPVGQRVAESAKTAYEKAKPVAESAAAKTSESAAAAWQATKGGTLKAVNRVRSMSGVHKAPDAIPNSEDSSLGETREDPEIGEITSEKPAVAEVESTEAEPEVRTEQASYEEK